MKRLIFLLLIGCCSLTSFAQKKISLKILQTSDIHGNYFPYDFIEEKPGMGSLSRVSTYLKQEKKKYGDYLLMLDNGDILQGQPSAYYYNYIDTVTPHLCARILNYMGVATATFGNHDIETGHAVYDRIVKQSNFPWLDANAVRNNDGNPYFKPYYIREIDGIRIAVLGMITPGIPTWLPENLWSGMHFTDVYKETDSRISFLKEKEKADIIIGLFHLGMESRILSNGMDEGGGLEMAKNIPGLDVLMLGHDHRADYRKIANIKGDSVVIINPGYAGNQLSEVELIIHTNKKGQIVSKNAGGRLIKMSDYEPDPEFMEHFSQDYNIVKNFVSKKIGTFIKTISTRDAYFGPSAFVDLIHQIQLELTGADVSFVAPLSYDTKIDKGDIFVSDMFKLYKYENLLYTMELSGSEIKGFLENSYAIWINQMKSPEDHLLLLEENDKTGRYRFVNASYNFDSAAGISYTVDVTKPAGERITVNPQMMNGKTFSLEQKYKVAVNSYRGNGGGEHLTKGAGISLAELPSRIIKSTNRDLRFYMMQWIEKKNTVNPEIISDWRFIPENWIKNAAEKDYRLLFGK